MIVPISDRSRKYGYLFWPKAADADVRVLLSEAHSVEVSFGGNDLGARTVDWKRRRISVGPLRTREIPEGAGSFVLSYSAPKLSVSFR